MNQRHQANYYYSGASSNHYSPRRDEDETKDRAPWMTPCLWILAVILVLIILIIVICLIIFFTWGPVYVKTETVSGSNADQAQKANQALGEINPEVAAIPPKFSQQQEERNKPEAPSASVSAVNHFDLDLPSYVLNALEKGKPKICIFDTAVDFSASEPYKPINGRIKYVNEHIFGARHFDVTKVVNFKDKGSVEMAHPLEFQRYCRSLGIDNDCHVILYDRAKPYGSITSATFVWYLFKLYGHSKVTVINGGLQAWKFYTRNDSRTTFGEDYGLIQEKGDFTAEWRPGTTVDYSDFQRGLIGNTYRPIDSRTPEEFSSFAKNPSANDYGRIKGAQNVPLGPDIFSDDSCGSLKNIQEIKSLLKVKNLDPSGSYVVYDNMPLNGSAVYFALVQLGYDVRLYHGGWIEWSYRAPNALKEKPSRLSKFASLL